MTNALSNNQKNEKIKLTANFLNSIGAGIVVAGSVPALITVGLANASNPANATLWIMVAIMVACIFSGVMLHLSARCVLNGLAP